MQTNLSGLLVAVALVATSRSPLWGQMEMQQSRPLGMAESRMGSGTSWLPDASPMHDAHRPLGAWMLMLHGSASVQYDWQGGARGGHQLGVLNWVMASASRPLAGGWLEGHGMLSAEPWTVGGRGYPLLAQSGETYEGAALHDRQHPHDLFMELAALYERPVARRLGVSLYLAPVGEPAVGPVAFPHRPSASADPVAPLSHHWQDATHITFGVVTAGVFTHAVKLEASWFNGREPDENRTDFDYAGRSLDSFGARLSVNPGPRWGLSAWYAYLKSPEQLFPQSLHRLGAAALTTQRLGAGGTWSSALIWGANVVIGTERVASSVVVESTFELGGGNSCFGRAEYVRKNAEELVITAGPPATDYDIGALALGYLRRLGSAAGLTAGIGLRGSVTFLPASVSAVYGSRTPAGLVLYLLLRPTGGHGHSMMMMNEVSSVRPAR